MRETTVEELKKMRDEGVDHQLIDVREEYEYDTGNIDGSELIPMGTIPENLDKIARDKPVVIQCKSGSRSGAIVTFLENNGFRNVSNLKGGIIAWSNQIDNSVKY